MKRRVHWFKSVSAAGIAAFSLSAAYAASNMNIYSDYGPGPGLYPLALGLLLAFLTLVWILQPVSENEVPEALSAGGIARVATILLSVALAVWLMPYLGFVVTSFLMIFAIMRVTGRHQLYFSAALAVVSSLAFQILFQKALGLSLPVSQLPLVSSLGL